MAFSNFFKQPILYNNDSIFGNEETKIIKYLNEICQKINEGMNNEKFVIVVGENHFGQFSLFHEALIFFAAAMAGMQNLLIEGTRNQLVRWVTNATKFDLLNLPKIAVMASIYGWNTYSMESNTDLTDEERNKVMSDFITNFQSNSMVILGMDHFYDVITQLEKNGISVLGFATSYEGCNLYILPSHMQTLDSFFIEDKYSYAIQLNDEKKWELFGINKEISYIRESNPEMAAHSNLTRIKKQTYTTKCVIPGDIIDALNEFDINIEVDDGKMKSIRLSNQQIDYLHSLISLGSNDTLHTNEKLRYQKQKNIIHTPKFTSIMECKYRDTISTIIKFIIKILSRDYALTCREQSSNEDSFHNDRRYPQK